MTGLRETAEKLARMRRQWEQLARAAASAGMQLPHPHEEGRLAEVTGFGSNPGRLGMWTHVPENLAPDAPLVVALHGCLQDAAAYDGGSGWSHLADRYGFALLLPEQQQANNPNACFNWFLAGDARRGRGEALSIRQMVERMTADHRLDRGRVFVTGLSAGGAMAVSMLAAYPEIFAGGAVLAGLPYGAAWTVRDALDAMAEGRVRSAAEWGEAVRRASRHKGGWPRLSIWHGTADTVVAPANARELVKQWTNLHGLPEEPDLRNTVDGQAHAAWRDAAGATVLETYAIEGMGHGLPLAANGSGSHDGYGAAGPFMIEAGISSSYRIAEFFGLTEGAGGRRSPRPKRANAAKVLDAETVIVSALKSAGLIRRGKG